MDGVFDDNDDSNSVWYASKEYVIHTPEEGSTLVESGERGIAKKTEKSESE